MPIDKVGKVADFVILSDDPTAVDPETLAELRVLVTVKNDTVVYEAEEGVREGKLDVSPFSSDPVVAHTFLHAIYQGMKVEQPWLSRTF
ncbi:amidohydrolase family protein [Ruegeria sp.]|uniref:amidohydrolase family protein n=1 Tax=Ruegeria sp. TaxID=1879320 RepID=UPI003AFF9C15